MSDVLSSLANWLDDNVLVDELFTNPTKPEYFKPIDPLYIRNNRKLVDSIIMLNNLLFGYFFVILIMLWK